MGEESVLPPRPLSPAWARQRLEQLGARLEQTCRALADSPVSLFLLLCATNAVLLPYANIRHDATLYAVQALNKAEPGHFDQDLYFIHGSQDKYSLFSTLAAPLTSVLGVRPAFFLLFLVFNGLFLLGLQRLVLAVVPDRALAVAALLCVAVVAVPYSGGGVFRVNESFTTPRLLANALVLLGLERLLAGRTLAAALLLAAALPAHPLMAFPGVLIAVAWWMLTHLPRWAWLAAAGTAVLLLAVTLAYPPLAFRLFGTMEPEWREEVRLVNPYNFPAEWSLYDWLGVATALVLAVAAAFNLRTERPAAARLLLVTGVVAVVGVLGMVVATALPYALPIQGQPYRALWLLQLWPVPLTIWLCGRLWQHGTGGRLLALALMAGLTLGIAALQSKAVVVFAAGAMAVLYWGRLQRQGSWGWWAAGSTLAGGLLLWQVMNVGSLAQSWQDLRQFLDDLELVYAVLGALENGFRWLLVLGLLAALAGVALTSGRFRAAALAVALGCHGAFFLLGQLPPTGATAFAQEDEVRFVADFLDERRPETPHPVVYWPGARLDRLWLDLRVNTYFEIQQLSGVIFSRGTSLEGRRRCLLVRRFELERLRQIQGRAGEWQWNRYARVFDPDGGPGGPPDVEDLRRLADEPGLDYMILPWEFPGLYVRTHGRYFVYDCQTVRSSGPRRF